LVKETQLETYLVITWVHLMLAKSGSGEFSNSRRVDHSIAGADLHPELGGLQPGAWPKTAKNASLSLATPSDIGILLLFSPSLVLFLDPPLLNRSSGPLYVARARWLRCSS